MLKLILTLSIFLSNPLFSNPLGSCPNNSSFRVFKKVHQNITYSCFNKKGKKIEGYEWAERNGLMIYYKVPKNSKIHFEYKKNNKKYYISKIFFLNEIEIKTLSCQFSEKGDVLLENEYSRTCNKLYKEYVTHLIKNKWKKIIKKRPSKKEGL